MNINDIHNTIDAEWENLVKLPREEVLQYLTQMGADKTEAREAICATGCFTPAREVL